MEFADPAKVMSVIDNLQVADSMRAANRAIINGVFNGDPPYTQAEADEGQIDTNNNFLQGTRIIGDARLKMYSAMFGDDTLFTVSLNDGDMEMRDVWASYITDDLNASIRDCLVFIEEQRQKVASMFLHGWGAMVWDHPDRWCPYFVSMENIKIPGRTLVSLRNLEYFAVYRPYTPSQLKEKIDSKRVNSGWNIPLAKKAIEVACKKVTKSLGEDTYQYRPELWEEDYKSNSGFYGSDVVATIDTWELYYKDDAGKIQSKVVLWDPNAGSGYTASINDKTNAFLFESKTPIADDFSQVLSLPVTDGNTVAPFRLDTVRSLGFLLYADVDLDNRLRSKLFDAIFESLLNYYSHSGAKQDATPAFRLQNFGIIPDGYKIIGQNERNQVNEGLVGAGINQLRQAMTELSGAFTEDLKTSSNPNETATAIIAKVNAASALLSGMLTMSYIYQKKEYVEMCRRFTKKGTTDPDCKAFQQNMKEKGVPEDLLDVKKWSIRVNKPIGAGNKTLEMVKVDKLMSARGAFSEPAQQMILRKFAIANTDDSALAAALVPPEDKIVSRAAELASIAMGSLMQGLPVLTPSNIAEGEFTFALISLAKVVVKRIEDRGGMATEPEVVGLATVVQEINEHIGIIAKDPQKKQAVKILSDQSGQIANYVKGYAQRLSEQDGGVDPKVAAAIEKARIEAQSKADINAMASMAKENRKDEGFQREAARRDAQARQNMAIKNMEASMKLALADAEKAAEINRQ